MKSMIKCIKNYSIYLFLLLPDIVGAQFTELTPSINGEAAGNFSLNGILPDRYTDITADGMSIAIGGPSNNGTGNNGSNRGTVRVYTRIGDNWIKQGADIDGEADNDFLGFSVAIAKDASGALIVAVGSPFNDAGGDNAGSVRLFKLSGGNWILHATVRGYRSSRAGYAIDLSDDGANLAVGYPNADKLNFNGSINTVNTGMLRVFRIPLGGGAIQLGEDIYGDALDDLGNSVAISGNGERVVVGASLSSVKTNFYAIGYARVFRLVGSTWFIESEFKGNQKHTQYFGQSVAISADGNRIAIGGLNYQDPQGNEGEVGPCRGIVKTYERSATTWNQIGTDLIGSNRSDCSYVVSLSADGRRLSVGGPTTGNKGGVKIYNWTNAWSEVGAGILLGVNTGDQYGKSQSLSSDGNRIVIGAPFNGINGARAGNTQVWQLSAPAAVKSVVFDIDDNVSEAKGKKVMVPVKVSNFINIRSFSMSVQTEDKSIASISNITSALTGFDRFESESGKTWTIRYNNSTPITLDDGSVVFTIELTLNGNVNQSTKINIVSSPLSIIAAKFENGSTSAVMVEVKSGSVIIKEQLIDLSGKVKTIKNIGIQNASVMISGTANAQKSTDQDGNYNFTNLNPGNYSLSVSKQNNGRNGVDIFDLTALEDHIITRSTITDPYRYLAADVNNDGVLDIFDLTDMEDVIITRKSNFNNNLSWRFLPTNENLTIDKVKNKNYVSSRSVNATSSFTGLDFYGIKTGDIVDDNVNPKDLTIPSSENRIYPEQRSAGSLSLRIPEIKSKKNESLFIPIILETFIDVRAFQFQVKWNPMKINFQSIADITTQLNGFGKTNYLYDDNNPGVLNVLWKSTDNQTVTNNTILFKLNLKLLANTGETISLELTDVKANSVEGGILNPKITNGKVTSSDVSTSVWGQAKSIGLLSIFPNPTSDFISVNSNEILDQLQVYDMNGRLVKTIIQKINNQYHIDVRSFVKGIYLLKANAGDQILVEKVIVQ